MAYSFAETWLFVKAWFATYNIVLVSIKCIWILKKKKDYTFKNPFAVFLKNSINLVLKTISNKQDAANIYYRN